jgi:hypothetical protein
MHRDRYEANLDGCRTPRSVSSVGSLEIVVDALHDAHAATGLGNKAPSECAELRALVLEKGNVDTVARVLVLR